MFLEAVTEVLGTVRRCYICRQNPLFLVGSAHFLQAGYPFTKHLLPTKILRPKLRFVACER